MGRAGGWWGEGYLDLSLARLESDQRPGLRSHDFPHVTDDFFQTPESWDPPRDENTVYLLASDDQGLYGFGIFHPRNRACYDGHLGFLPRNYGETAAETFKRMLAWMWAYTPAERIVGEILSDNRRAIQFAVRCGFSQYGVNQLSKRVGGRLRDQVCLGISKPE